MYRLSAQIENKPIKLDDDSESSSVESSGSRIFFYSDVTKDSILALNKEIRAVSNNLQNISQVYEIPAPPLRLHINSYGGSLLDCFSTVDYIRNSKTPIHTIIEGSAASAATIISVVGHRRYIHKHSYMLIHQLSTGLWGKYEELVDDFKNSTAFMEQIQNIYRTHTKIPTKTLKEILKRDLWFDSATCLKYGLVDEIIGE